MRKHYTTHTPAEVESYKKAIAKSLDGDVAVYGPPLEGQRVTVVGSFPSILFSDIVLHLWMPMRAIPTGTSRHANASDRARVSSIPVLVHHH